MSPNRRTSLMLLIAVLSVTALGLSRWQWARHASRRDANALLRTAQERPPLDLGLPAAKDSVLSGRRIAAVGQFLTDQQIILRGRAYREAPGVHVATPFRTDETGAVIWVLRGFALAADGFMPTGPITAPVTGSVRITGVTYDLPVTNNAGQPVVGARGDTTWQRLDRGMALARFAGALEGYVLLEGGTTGPGRLPAAEPPALDAGPHLSYTIQWIGIAVAIAAFGVIALRPRDPSRAPPLGPP